MLGKVTVLIQKFGTSAKQSALNCWTASGDRQALKKKSGFSRISCHLSQMPFELHQEVLSTGNPGTNTVVSKATGNQNAQLLLTNSRDAKPCQKFL